MLGVNDVHALESVLRVSYLNFVASSLVSNHLHSVDRIGRKRIKKAGKQAGRGISRKSSSKELSSFYRFGKKLVEVKKPAQSGKTGK